MLSSLITREPVEEHAVTESIAVASVAVANIAGVVHAFFASMSVGPS